MRVVEKLKISPISSHIKMIEKVEIRNVVEEESKSTSKVLYVVEQETLENGDP